MASPWGKIEKIEEVNFAEIMSEEYARGLQDEEIKKYGKQVSENVMKTSTEIADDKLKDPGEINIEIIPEDVLKLIREDESLAGAAFSDISDSDILIAQVLQSQYDHEYNEELKRIEKQRNKNSKVRISLDNFRRDGGFESEEEYYDDDDYDNPKRDWDRFETNEKIFETIPKCGFKVDKEGEMITKHDPQICGVRNACRVMSFPPEFPTGDGAGFDMKLSNAVFNQLKTYSRKQKKNKSVNRKENIATAEMGVDLRTRLVLYKLVNSQTLGQVNGIISTGKEAVILHADNDPSYDGDLLVPKECAIKIFKTTLNEFKQRDRYIKDDYRFKERFSKKNNRVVISMWAEKEMHNLKRMAKCGIPCPSVVLLKNHILVMSFIGHNHFAAPKLKDACLNDAEWSLAYEQIVEIMHKLFNEAKLVHADFSEYNILWKDGQCWIIDVAQSIEPGHPSALEFLMRDCDNIITFFTRRGVPNIFSKEQLFEHITALNAESYNASMLERIHTRGASITDATAPNQDTMPDEKKPISYPFDMAWEKSVQDKQKTKLQNILPATIVETVDALQVLEIHLPSESNIATAACKN